MTEYRTLKEWAEAEPNALRRTVDAIGGNGHMIWEPEHFPDVPAHLLPITVERSDGTHKGSIFNAEGQVIPELRGVYGLNLSYRLVDALSLKVREFHGRGFQCRANCEAIYSYLESKS